LNIGQGSVLFGTFDSIAWGNGTYFVKVEFDPQGGTNFVVMGTSQLLSVPYSLYAQHAKLADGTPVQTAKLIATNLQLPFDNPATGLLVYNTDSGGKVPFNVFPGYYYNAGTPQAPNWVMLNTSNSPNRIADVCPGGSNSWGCTAGPSGPISGTNNTGYGYNALNMISSESYNTAYGWVALQDIAGGQYNSAFGSGAMVGPATVTGYYNTAEGYNSSMNMYTGYYNTSNGMEALFYNTVGTGNVADGTGALYSVNYGVNSGGNWNTAVGDSAGFDDITGSYNSYVGYKSNDGGIGNLTNATAIGYNTAICQSNSMSFGNQQVTSWNFGTCSPCSSGAVITVNAGSGVYMDNGGNWHPCSDRNQKRNFTAIDNMEVLNKVAAMPVTQWNYKWDAPSVKHIGPMAQDFYKAFKLDDDSLHILAIDEAGVAFAAIQALNQKLEAEKAALQAENATLKQQITQLAQNQAKNEKEIAEIQAKVGSMSTAQASIK